MFGKSIEIVRIKRFYLGKIECLKTIFSNGFTFGNPNRPQRFYPKVADVSLKYILKLLNKKEKKKFFINREQENYLFYMSPKLSI